MWWVGVVKTLVDVKVTFLRAKVYITSKFPRLFKEVFAAQQKPKDPNSHNPFLNGGDNSEAYINTSTVDRRLIRHLTEGEGGGHTRSVLERNPRTSPTKSAAEWWEGCFTTKPGWGEIHEHPTSTFESIRGQI